MSEQLEPYRGKDLKDLVIGIVGGTGAQGTGLGYRLANAGFKVILGSRDGSKHQQSPLRLVMEYPG
jgi:predicted dinucleotide-binding enzyme